MKKSKDNKPQAVTTDIQPTIWHHQPALVLENDTLSVTVVPEMGAKIVSLFDKRSQLEWLFGPGQRPFKPVPYGSVFTDQDMSGWDEMFPTIVECTYPWAEKEILLPDHGEIWTLPWQQISLGQDKLSFAVEGRALNYKFCREIEFVESASLKFTYQALNLSTMPMHVIWAAHPQFKADLQTRIVLPPHINTVLNVLPEEYGWGAPGTKFKWPKPDCEDGRSIRLDTVGPPDLKQARKFYLLPDMEASWVGMLRETDQCWMTISWDSEDVPYFGLWVDEGYFNPEPVIAPEPSTGFYDSLAFAANQGRHMTIEPGDTASWSLVLQFGNQKDQFPYPCKPRQSRH
jgi:galactose mutarotase-like enzyme